MKRREEALFGWCETCKAITLEGWCSKHGETKPIPTINKVDVCPLPEFKKDFLNSRMDGLKLGNGIFLVYGDRLRRNIIVALNEPLLEIKVRKNDVKVTPLIMGKFEGMTPDSLIQANSERIERLEKTSKSFAKQELESSKNAILSFSGGKDSVVLAHLLAEHNLKKVFIDTGIEFPETYNFIDALKKEGWDIDCARTENNFFDLCSEKGYPARRNRWCCKTQKFYPFEKYMRDHYGNEPVLVFGAERRWENLYRIDEPFKRQNKNIPNQQSVHIMLDWTAMDVWIYTWKNMLPISEIYRYYDRGGCWPCPFGLTYRIFLMELAHPKFFRFLQNVGATMSLRSYWEGKPMKNLVFMNPILMNAVAENLSNLCPKFDIDENRGVISVPASVSKFKLESLIRETKADIGYNCR
jgi:phosphoadenosine phosphosulfate reductase